VERAKGAEARKKVYALASRCVACERPIVPGQTWKFTPSGGKIHYHCAAVNPEWSPESGEPWPGMHGRGRFGIVNTLTLVRLPYRFESHQDAQEWIDSYGVSSEYKRNYKIVEDQGNPYGEPTGFCHPGPKGYTIIKHTSELMGYGERGQPIYRLETSLLWNRTKALARAKSIEAQGFKAEVIDNTSYQHIYGAVENPTGLTFPQAMSAARQAGARIGDTSGFEPWLRKAGLEGRSPHVVSRLRAEFEQGVEHGSTRPTMAKGVLSVWQDSEGWRSAAEPESVFESKAEAERFTTGWSRNPSVASIRAQYLKLIERYAYAYESKKLERMTQAHEALEQFETKHNLDPNSRQDAIRFLKRTRVVNLSLMHALDSINDFHRGNPEQEYPRFVPIEDDWPIGPIRWSVVDTHTGAKVREGRMWIRTRTRQAAERKADKLNRKDRKERRMA